MTVNSGRQVDALRAFIPSKTQGHRISQRLSSCVLVVCVQTSRAGTYSNVPSFEDQGAGGGGGGGVYSNLSSFSDGYQQVSRHANGKACCCRLGSVSEGPADRLALIGLSHHTLKCGDHQAAVGRHETQGR